MREKIKKQLSKTGAIIATATIVSSLIISTPNIAYAQGKEESLISRIGNGIAITSDELYNALNDKDASSKIAEYISLGKNVKYNTNLQRNNTIRDMELEYKLKKVNEDINIEYTGLGVDTSSLPAQIYYEYIISENPNKIEKGIDVSSWQGIINWNEVSNQIDFAIIRVMDAIVRDENNNYVLDSQFLRNIQECERLNIPIGVYWFSRATNEEEAKREASFVGQVLQGYTLEYPTYIDVECEAQLNLDDQTLQNIIVAANNEIAKYNLSPAIYINNSQAHRVENLPYQLWLTSSKTYDNHVSMSEFSQDEFSVYYPLSEKKTNYQYCSKGSISGIEGNVDFDYALNSIKNQIVNSEEYQKRTK